MSLPYDFWVNGIGTGLGFNKRIAQDFPYERATAQWRKDQLDTAQTVGDQSLTGWWTRGQLSFHKGAGIKYYEVLDGDAVLDRFTDCDSVEVFEPGEVTLLPEVSDLSLGTLDAVAAPPRVGGGVYALTDTGVEYTAGVGSTAIDTSDSGVPTSITVGPDGYFVTNGNLIESQASPSEARTNYVTNPSFTTSLGGWSFSGGAVGLSSTVAKYGTQSVHLEALTTAARSATTTLTGLTIGVTYVASMWVYIDDQPAGTPRVVTLEADATVVDTADTSIEGDWQRLTGTFLATATSHTLALKITSGNNQPDLFIDAIMFTESPYVGDFFDGSFPLCAWTGAAHLSTSTYATATDTATLALITLSGGADWAGAWWAKGRIFAVDTDGYWYALPAAIATVSNADAFWNSGRSDVAWSLSDGPGPVYISDGYDIYTVTLDTDGLVPTIAIPTTASRVPQGEVIASITFYLGYLIVATTKGVRVAATDDTRVALGPLTIKGDFSASVRVGIFDTKVYVAGRPDGRAGANVLCAIDLSRSVSDLVFAWAPQFTISELASTASGAVVSSTGAVYAWAAETLLMGAPDALSEDGYLTTGYLRFATLEPKHFHSVLARVGGGGTVEVYRVDGDGTETLLDTIDAPDVAAEIPLGLDDPAERVALKFVLSRAEDSTLGPTLLGYQLKALPVPRRQRLIRVPLMLFDREVDGVTKTKRGRPGDAWTRLQALEALEESNAVVTFDDSETGETGTAYVESVEVRRTAPTSQQNDGFGGLLYLTLRKL